MRKGIKLVARILRVTTINGLPALLRKPLIMNQLSKENKINMSSVKVLILLIMSTVSTFAQTTFGYEDFKNLVLKNHPTVKQANLFIRDAQTEIMQAQGAFDPKLTSYFDRKSFKGIDLSETLVNIYWKKNLQIF